VAAFIDHKLLLSLLDAGRVGLQGTSQHNFNLNLQISFQVHISWMFEPFFIHYFSFRRKNL
jgi:hypothetical protein